MSTRNANFVRWGFAGFQLVAVVLIIYGDLVHDHRYFVYPYCAVALAYIVWERRMRRLADSTTISPRKGKAPKSPGPDAHKASFR